MKPISQNMYLIVLTPIHRYTSRIRPIFSNQLWETPNNDVMTELWACPRWDFRQHASQTLATLSIDQSLSISHCQCTSNSHHTLMINHYLVIKFRWSTKTPIVYDPLTTALTTIDPLSPNTPKNRNLWFLFSSQDLSDTSVWQLISSV